MSRFSLLYASVLSKLIRLCYSIGRSGRYGRKGVAINFVKSDDIRILRDIEQYYATQIDEMPMNGECRALTALLPRDQSYVCFLCSCRSDLSRCKCIMTSRRQKVPSSLVTDNTFVCARVTRVRASAVASYLPSLQWFTRRCIHSAHVSLFYVVLWRPSTALGYDANTRNTFIGE